MVLMQTMAASPRRLTDEEFRTWSAPGRKLTKEEFSLLMDERGWRELFTFFMMGGLKGPFGNATAERVLLSRFFEEFPFTEKEREVADAAQASLGKLKGRLERLHTSLVEPEIKAVARGLARLEAEAFYAPIVGKV